jgi:uncharacterized protein
MVTTGPLISSSGGDQIVKEDVVTALQAAREPTRYVKARRIRFRFAQDAPLLHHYAGNDVAMSHLTSILSAAFPAGEEAFIRSVRHYADRITDPVLKEQVKGFMGQEMTHGREHRNLNETLQEMGYPTKFIDELGKRLESLEKVVPPILPLAMTAAAEHYTATLAERVLSSPDVQALGTDAETMSLLNWHAMEELEHKAVAFDVYRAVGGSEALRIATMGLIFTTSFALVVIGLIFSMSFDPEARRRPLHSARRIAALPRSPLIKGMAPTLLKYLRPGFHPNDIHTEELLTRWQQELFGPDGQLVDHLK